MLAAVADSECDLQKQAEQTKQISKYDKEGHENCWTLCIPLYIYRQLTKLYPVTMGPCQAGTPFTAFLLQALPHAAESYQRNPSCREPAPVYASLTIASGSYPCCILSNCCRTLSVHTALLQNPLQSVHFLRAQPAKGTHHSTCMTTSLPLGSSTTSTRACKPLRGNRA